MGNVKTVGLKVTITNMNLQEAMGNMNEPAINYQEELKKCKTMDDVFGRNGLMQKLLKDVIQNLLEAEMVEHLGREKYERLEESADNYRNGYTDTMQRSSLGEMEINVPRDRKGEFDPIAVKK